MQLLEKATRDRGNSVVRTQNILSRVLGSISPTFYEQLLRTQIPKMKKDSQIKQLFALLGPAWVKAARKHIDEIDPWLPLRSH